MGTGRTVPVSRAGNVESIRDHLERATGTGRHGIGGGHAATAGDTPSRQVPNGTTSGRRRRWFGRRRERLDPELADWTLSRARTLWMCVALLLVSLPHATHLPAWVLPLFALIVLYKCWLVWQQRPTPPRILTLLLGLCCIVGVGLSMGTVLGREAGIALLTLLAALKLLETSAARDAYVVIFLGFFLVLTNFLYSQSLTTGGYMLLVVLQLTACMWVLGTPSRRSQAAQARAALRQAATALFWSAPIALALFFLFPRLPGPLWKLPRDAHAGVSGLSEQMSPGDLSELSQSDALAFRVYFDSPPPPSSNRYWRGPVLTRTDGRTWHRAPAPHRRPRQGVQPLGALTRYSVELEPHQQRWLFALDVPVELPPGAMLNHDLELRSGRSIRRDYRYEMVSATSYRLDVDPRSVMRINLQLPLDAHPMARQLAARWKRLATSDGALLELALGFFRDGGFSYTLSPPLLPGDPVDQFLFQTRAGFCEHYASAFTVLMRAAGIPARVVTGYQGGEINPISGHLSVRQRDAHAWSEVWLVERGWVRVDPTAAVAPERVQIGARATLLAGDQLGADRLANDGGIDRLWKNLEHTLDYLDSTWNRWVLGYGNRQQEQLLGRLGIDASSLTQLALWILGVTVTVMVLASLWLVRQPPSRDPLQRAWHRLRRRLGAHGIHSDTSEGLEHLSARIAASHPHLAETAGEALRRLARARYGRPPADDIDRAQALRELDAAIQAVPRRPTGHG
ncbi:MAG: DUF3488 domain-containing transglutaminase family protein [Gammaproteobacteria bacterium]|nr:DUF3488 domain-containing transglutaminase family protein [Gammaproteobacteria bacterium]